MKKKPTASAFVLLKFPPGFEEWSWIVWAIGGLSVRERDHVVDVFLAPSRAISPRGNAFKRALVPVGLLPALSLGQCWRQGKLKRSESVQYETFHLTEVSASKDYMPNKQAHDTFASKYWLPFEVFSEGFHVRATGRLADAKGEKVDCTVIIPCPVIFTAFYGVNSRLARLLTQHPAKKSKMSWERRLWLEKTVEDDKARSFFSDGHLHVCLSRLVDDDCARTVAWFYLDEVARDCAKAIPQLVSTGGSKSFTTPEPSHLRAALPFSSPVSLSVEGILLEERNELLVTKIVGCDFELSGVKRLTFDRENDARHAPLPPGVKVRSRSRAGGGMTAAAQKAGKSINPTRKAKAGQRPVIWEVGNTLAMFPGLEVKKTPKKHSVHERAPKDKRYDEADSELACGEGSYLKDAAPPTEITPALIGLDWDELKGRKEFQFFLKVLSILSSRGWAIACAVGDSILFSDPRPMPESKSKPQRRFDMIAVKLSRGRKMAYVCEFQEGHASTVLAYSKSGHDQVSSLVQAVLRSALNVKALQGRASSLASGWVVRLSRHQWTRKVRKTGKSKARGKKKTPFTPEPPHAKRIEDCIESMP